MKVKTSGVIFSTIFFALIFILLVVRPFHIILVDGNSMSPTLKDKQFLLFTPVAGIKKNDLVVFNAPKSWSTDETELIKRVVATPGDKIHINNGAVYVNDKWYADFVNKISTDGGELSIIVPEGKYFVMGDNVGHSSDSLSNFLHENDTYLISKERIKYIKRGVKRVGSQTETSSG